MAIAVDEAHCVYKWGTGFWPCYAIIEKDLGDIIWDLRVNSIKANRVLIYCLSVNMCSNLYTHFVYELGDYSYYPLGAERIASYRLWNVSFWNS